MNQAIKMVYESVDYRMLEIADAFGLHYPTVSIASHQASLKKAWLHVLDPHLFL
ncbi:hypothetical protein NTGM5_400024 [Candidatus Nitrotoga sp. M5]|nr:hypothetical protein NTGM5_400024 [Candidatus Nitrotoga sp. M5]